MHHYVDFNITIAWHFHTTTHRNGVSDSVGGTIKCQAARESLSIKQRV